MPKTLKKEKQISIKLQEKLSLVFSKLVKYGYSLKEAKQTFSKKLLKNIDACDQNKEQSIEYNILLQSLQNQVVRLGIDVYSSSENQQKQQELAQVLPYIPRKRTSRDRHLQSQDQIQVTLRKRTL